MMKKRILVLSGGIASGKSSVARLVAERFGFHIISTRGILEQLPAAQGRALTRTDLQELGNRLDSDTNGSWVLDGCQRPLEIPQKWPSKSRSWTGNSQPPLPRAEGWLEVDLSSRY
jgi:hypothetical protein